MKIDYHNLYIAWKSWQETKKILPKKPNQTKKPHPVNQTTKQPIHSNQIKKQANKKGTTTNSLEWFPASRRKECIDKLTHTGPW